MSSGFDRKGYWERKILGWERARYEGIALLKPASWTLRRRLNSAARIIRRALPRGGSLLDLGCASGLLAERLRGHYGSYHGVDFAGSAIEEARARRSSPQATFEQDDVLRCNLPAADLTVFLGLVDWLEPEEIPPFFARLASPRVLFSYTEARAGGLGPYGLYRAYYDRKATAGRYRARSYRWEEVAGWISAFGQCRIERQPAVCFDPGRLVLVEKDGVKG